MIPEWMMVSARPLSHYEGVEGLGWEVWCVWYLPVNETSTQNVHLWFSFFKSEDENT